MFKPVSCKYEYFVNISMFDLLCFVKVLFLFCERRLSVGKTYHIWCEGEGVRGWLTYQKFPFRHPPCFCTQCNFAQVSWLYYHGFRVIHRNVNLVTLLGGITGHSCGRFGQWGGRALQDYLVQSAMKLVNATCQRRPLFSGFDYTMATAAHARSRYNNCVDLRHQNSLHFFCPRRLTSPPSPSNTLLASQRFLRDEWSEL